MPAYGVGFRLIVVTVRRLAAAASHGKPLWEAKGKDASHPVGRIDKQTLFYRFCAKGIGASMWFFVSDFSSLKRGGVSAVELDTRI